MTDNSIRNELEKILPQLRAYARSVVPSVHDADDLVSKTCIRILERTHQFDQGRSLVAWAIRIMKNISIDDYRKQRPIADEVHMDMVPDNDNVISDPGNVMDIGRLVHRLPAEQREVLVLSGIGYRYSEIATDLDIPIGTVMSRLKRGRDALYELMNDGD